MKILFMSDLLPYYKETLAKELVQKGIKNFKLSDKQIIQIMRKHLKRSSFILWRNRVRGRKTKYQKKNNLKFLRHQSYDHNKHR